jgi:hypothetical protein
MLADYEDAFTSGLVPRHRLRPTLRAAFAEYGQNARHPRTDGLALAPGGELAVIHDEDAGW